MKNKEDNLFGASGLYPEYLVVTSPCPNINKYQEIYDAIWIQSKDLATFYNILGCGARKYPQITFTINTFALHFLELLPKTPQNVDNTLNLRQEKVCLFKKFTQDLKFSHKRCLLCL